MMENNCFICNSRLPPPQAPNTSESLLAHQLRAIFLLRNVCELPSWTLQKYLISSSGRNPSQWLSVCRECDHLVRKTKIFYDDFMEADRKFRRAKYDLVRKIKECVSSSGTLSPAVPPGFINCVRISDDCHQFVQLHDYDEPEPTENPFREGDHRAKEMLGVAVDFDVTNLNVKTEVVECMTVENHNYLELQNVADFSLYNTIDMDLSTSQDLSLTPEGHQDGDTDDGGYQDDDDHHDYDDDDFEFLPPGPKCRKREAKAKLKGSATSTKNVPDPQSDEITAAEASNLIQFLTTSRGKRMVRYDGHYFHNATNHPGRGASSSGMTHFNCKWRRHYGCPARITFRNYNDEDTTYTGFMANLEPHDHSTAPSGRDMTMNTIWYEVNAVAKDIVKDNMNLPPMQVVQMVQDSFLSDPEVTQELSKENVKENLKRVIANMKRRLGWKPPGQMPMGGGSHPEQKNADQPEMKELTSAEASTLIQFLPTSRGKRMVRYDGHNFYNCRTRRPTISRETYFNCGWRRHGCPARIILRDYNYDDATFTGFIANSEPHDHSARSGPVTKRDPIWYEVNALAKEIVKDNVNVASGQVIQMVQDSFLGDLEVTQELRKENVKNNLRKVVAKTKRKLGWKPDPNVKLKRQRTSTQRKRAVGVATVNVT